MNPITVTQLTTHIKTLFEEDALLRDVWISAEVSSWKRVASGHIYFSMKDGGASISSVMWRGNAYRLTWAPRAGDQIVAHGYVGIYPERGVYQFYADEVRPAGRGQLYAQFEALKERLAAEGLFEAARKRAIPQAPQRLGIVTSSGAAALQDVLRVLGERWPLSEVFLFATQVQGAAAPSLIVQALAAANIFPATATSAVRYSHADHAELPLPERDGAAGSRENGARPDQPLGAGLDTILLVRGGGSIEDLWAFNDELVAYAIAESSVPVITGIGHETDFTIADFVSDLRAPTPTGAAVAATPDRREVLESIRQTFSGLLHESMEAVATRRAMHEEMCRRLERGAPLRQIDIARQRLDEAENRMRRTVVQLLQRRQERLLSGAARLESLNPSSILTRGYSIVQKEDGPVVTAPDQSAPGERLIVRAAGGEYAVVRERNQ